MSLFKFTEPTQEYGGAATLSPSESTDPNLPNSKLVNVVNDYAWTIQPKSARKDVPYLYMIERKLTNEVMIQQLIYNLAATFQVGEEISEDAFSFVKKFLPEDEQTTKTDKVIKSIVNESKSLNGSDPYTGLYSLEDTGWSYILPYFDKGNHNIGGEWGLPSEGGGLVSKLSQATTGIAGDIAQTVNSISSLLGSMSGTNSALKPGTYIEKAKQYNFQPQGASYSLSFNLYNTGRLQDVIDNWELCFALMYNLLPNRRTKTVFDPPPLYEIYIPGVRRSPVSFIKGMRVEFLGATRLMDLDVAGKNAFRTIVPDAYSIQIDIEDVLPESKNFMQSMIDESKRVNVSTKNIQTNATPEDSLKVNANNITHITLNPTQRTGVSDSGNSNPIETFANDNIAEPFKKAQRSIQRTVKDINKLPRGRF